MRIIRQLCGIVGLLVLSSCATTQETVQQCRKAAYSFCDKTAGPKDGTVSGSGPVDGAARDPAYQQCLDTQLETCAARPY